MSATYKNFHEGNMYLQDGILHIKYHPNTVIDENLLYKQFMFRKQLAQEKDLFFIIDLRNDINVTDEAITFVASHPCPDHIKAIALITNSGVDYVRGKLYSIFDNPNVNTKVFLSEEEARLWFNSLEANDFIGTAC